MPPPRRHSSRCGASPRSLRCTGRMLQALLRAPRRSVHALNGVSFSVRRGETLGIVGESGCGKSTLARCLVRLIEADAGTIRYDGADVRAARRRRAAGLQPPGPADLPGPLQLAQPAHDRAPDAGRGAARPPSAAAGGRSRTGSPSCWTWSACRAMRSTAIRTSSRAASGSGSASPGRSRSSRHA